MRNKNQYIPKFMKPTTSISHFQDSISYVQIIQKPIQTSTPLLHYQDFLLRL